VPFERLVGEAQVREPLQQGGDGEPRLEPRERRTQAEVHARTERVVLHVRARDVEAVGLRAHVRIPIRG
jgi:hypothetical protein